MAIIAISGKIGAGKDLIGNIITTITNFPKMSNEKIIQSINKEWSNNVFETKKFADALKDIVCLLIGCTREQLEDADFKNKELGEEWWYYQIDKQNEANEYYTCLISYLDAVMFNNDVGITSDNIIYNYELDQLVKPTPRLLLQLIGTECFRNTVHPNVWVNALMSEYKAKWVSTGDSVAEEDVSLQKEFPNWIITDLRFENELKAVKDRGGITIRVNREIKTNSTDDRILAMGIAMHTLAKEKQKGIYHPSETALDNAEFNYVIDNNGTIEELIEKVKEVLIKENII